MGGVCAVSWPCGDAWLSGPRAAGQISAKPSYLGFWIAKQPWGPWTQIHEETAWMPDGDPQARAYQPHIAPKWIAPDGRSFWLVWSDYQMRDGLEPHQAEFRRKFAANAMRPEDWERYAQALRSYMPYYTLNAQRVDLRMS
jgi:hypothetical protein